MALNFQQSGSAPFKRVLLVVLLVASLALATLYAREGEDGPLHAVQGAVAGLASPFKFVGAAAGAGTDAAGASLEDMAADASTLSELRAANAEMVEQVAKAEEYRLEAQRLQELLSLRDSNNIDAVAARVVGKSIEARSQTVTIDAGADAGVESGMTVMGSSGVVGQVVSTTGRTAEVRLLTDPNSGAAALVQSSGAEGIVRGSLEGLLYLENVDDDTLPQPGDIVVTSGLGGSYTRGLVIGTVVRVDAGQGNATGRIVVSPNDEASSLSEVLVVKGLASGDAAGTGGANGAGSGGNEDSEDNGDGNGGDGA